MFISINRNCPHSFDIDSCPHAAAGNHPLGKMLTNPTTKKGSTFNERFNNVLPFP